MYRTAFKYRDEVIFYFDSIGNKYVASGGNLAWRINNPGLVHSHSHFSRGSGSIGNCGRYANQRRNYFERQLANIDNVTIVDADSGLEHVFRNNCYQNIVKALIAKYTKERLSLGDASKHSIICSIA